jgi:hypothetical protein
LPEGFNGASPGDLCRFYVARDDYKAETFASDTFTGQVDLLGASLDFDQEILIMPTLTSSDSSGLYDNVTFIPGPSAIPATGETIQPEVEDGALPQDNTNRDLASIADAAHIAQTATV